LSGSACRRVMKYQIAGTKTQTRTKRQGPNSKQDKGRLRFAPNDVARPARLEFAFFLLVLVCHLVLVIWCLFMLLVIWNLGGQPRGSRQSSASVQAPSRAGRRKGGTRKVPSEYPACPGLAARIGRPLAAGTCRWQGGGFGAQTSAKEKVSRVQEGVLTAP
jgi:hypothetical protein